MEKKLSSVNEKYGVYGLTKEEDVTLYDGNGVDDYPEVAQTWLANYGMFVAFTRSHAAPKDAPLTEKEKRDKFEEMHQWLLAGCPKREKTMSVKVDPFTDAIAKVNGSAMSENEKVKAIEMLKMVYGKV